MCGIAGIIFSNDFHYDMGHARDLVGRMSETLKARGPDDSGVFVESPVALGHRRLSIIDPTASGAQPMSLGQDGPVIIFNGEIYNHKELRAEISLGNGGLWSSRSDTEVILRAYMFWGLDGLKRLEGIFAFALWDKRHRRLVLMRDRLGVKPLYYGKTSQVLVFGSEIKAVLASRSLNLALDDQAFTEFLWFGNTFADRTVYKNVRALEPGYWLISENDTVTLEPWWRLEEWLDKPQVTNDPRQAESLVLDRLDFAVTRQRVADVPVGLFLSGGVDSSSIAASLAQDNVQEILSFSAGFDFGEDESHRAAQVAHRLGLRHSVMRIEGSDLHQTLLALAVAHDEPFADAANIPLYLMCKHLTGKIKVVLQGDGGDELFGGYRRYNVMRNRWIWKFLPAIFSTLTSNLGRWGERLERVALAMGQSSYALKLAYLITVETYQRRPEGVFNSDRQRDLIESTDPFLAIKGVTDRLSKYEPVDQMMFSDLLLELPSTFLAKVDRASMAAGIEARVPFLDEELVRLAVRIPSQWKVTSTQTKVLLRDSQRNRLPGWVLDSPKHGFGVPYEHWLRTSLFKLAREYLLDKSFLETFSLNSVRVESMLQRHHQGSGNRGFMLWKLLQLAIWNCHVRKT